MKATKTKIGMYIYWQFKCLCDHTITWGAFADASFWEVRSKQDGWRLRTCKCQTKYRLTATSNEIDEIG